MDATGLAARNLWRRPACTVAIFIALSALGAALFVMTALYRSATESVRLSSERLGADAVVVPEGDEAQARSLLISGGPAAFSMKAEAADKLRAMPGVLAAASQLFIVSGPLACCALTDTLLVGFEPEHDFTVTPWLGDTLDRPLADDEIIVGSNILAEPGGMMAFYGKPFLIRGKMRPTGLGLIDSSVFIPMKGARIMAASSGGKLKLSADGISAVLVRFAPGAVPEEMAIKIEDMLPGHRVINTGSAFRQLREGLIAPLKAVAWAGALQWLVSMLLIATIFGITIGQRERETGTMRALGARRADIARILLFEVILLCAGAGIAGVGAGSALIFIIKPAYSPSPPMAFGLSAIVVAFSICTGLLAALHPLLRASRMSPSSAMRQG